MNTRKALFASKLALALVLAYVVVRVILSPGGVDSRPAPVSAQGKGMAQAIETTRLPDLSLEDYSEIVKRNPFGNSSQTTDLGQLSLTADSFGFDRSVSEDLGLVLFGTVSGSPLFARAVIKDLKTDVFDIYKIGQVVGNARIESIEANAVILLHDEQRKVLEITGWQFNSGDNNHVSSSQTTKEISKTLETDLLSEKTNTNIRTKIEHIENVLKKVTIKPYVVNGRTEGLRITGLENLKTGKRFGLKNGDVIRTINGHLLTSKQKAYQVFKKARSQEAITFELLRGDKPKKLSFTLR